MPVLVGTIVWVAYFREGLYSRSLDFLIDEDLLVTNNFILAELVPFLKNQNQKKIIDLLFKIKKLPMAIDWNQIIEYQYRCLKHGLSGVGIPDLIIAQNAKQNNCSIFSLDVHFTRMKDILALQMQT